MTKTERAEEKARKRVLNFIYKWKRVLGLHMWEISVDWVSQEEMRDCDHERGVDVNPEFGSIMTISPNPEYMLAYMTVCLPLVMDKSDRHLDEYVCHELIHVVLSDLSLTKTKDLSMEDLKLHERVTTTLARAFIWTQDEGMEIKKKTQKTVKN